MHQASSPSENSRSGSGTFLSSAAGHALLPLAEFSQLMLSPAAVECSAIPLADGRSHSAQLKAMLQRMYGDRIACVVLFGFRVRLEARAASDYDVAVVLKDLPDPWRERFRLADLRVDFLDETGAFIEAQPFPATAYADRTALMHAIRTEGLEL